MEKFLIKVKSIREDINKIIKENKKNNFTCMYYIPIKLRRKIDMYLKEKLNNKFLNEREYEILSVCYLEV